MRVYSSRGQTSLEVLMIVAFILLLAALMSITYFGNQAKTNVSIQTKLLILPFIEKNGSLLKISEIKPVVSNSNLDILVRTKGNVDGGLITSQECQLLCTHIDESGYYSQTSFTWRNEKDSFPPVDVCAPVVC